MDNSIQYYRVENLEEILKYNKMFGEILVSLGFSQQKINWRAPGLNHDCLTYISDAVAGHQLFLTAELTPSTLYYRMAMTAQSDGFSPDVEVNIDLNNSRRRNGVYVKDCLDQVYLCHLGIFTSQYKKFKKSDSISFLTKKGNVESFYIGKENNKDVYVLKIAELKPETFQKEICDFVSAIKIMKGKC